MEPEDEDFIDNDPCPNCGSTRTAPIEEGTTVTRCSDCGEEFDVEDPSYGEPPLEG